MKVESGTERKDRPQISQISQMKDENRNDPRGSNDDANRVQLPKKPESRCAIRAQLGVQVAVGPRERNPGDTGGDWLEFVASTGALDRYGEVIDPRGWKLDAYRQNPVFQNAHRYGDVMFT